MPTARSLVATTAIIAPTAGAAPALGFIAYSTRSSEVFAETVGGVTPGQDSLSTDLLFGFSEEVFSPNRFASAAQISGLQPFQIDFLGWASVTAGAAPSTFTAFARSEMTVVFSIPNAAQYIVSGQANSDDPGSSVITWSLWRTDGSEVIYDEAAPDFDTVSGIGRMGMIGPGEYEARFSVSATASPDLAGTFEPLLSATLFIAPSPGAIAIALPGALLAARRRR